MADIDQKAWQFIRQQTMEENDYSKKIAVEDGRASYTYSDLFDNCRQYAAVFSALGMTQSKKARVGLIGTGAAETIFAFYGLNMTGAEVSIISSLSALKADKLMQVVQDEHLTDLIITDEFIREESLRRIVQKKDELGLRFIILLHLPMCGCTVPPQISMAFEQKAAFTRAFWGPLYMDFLIRVYGGHPVEYAENTSADAAAIIHTSGTTGGSGSPIVMSDKALNFMCRSISEIDGYDHLKDAPVMGLAVDLSNAYGMIVQVHFPLALGGKVVIVPGNTLNPLFYRAVSCHKFTVLFTIGMVLDMWMKFPEAAGFDFSSVKLVVLGGVSVSAADKKRYRDFLAKHGCKDAPIVNGYGISELGGVCALSTEEIEDESIGYMMKGFDARFLDEDTGRFYTPDDAPCTGVMYLHSGSMATLELDGKPTVKYEMMDGRPFVCTNDLIDVAADGKLTYLGRANRYFLHKDGEKYQSGRVETEMSRQSGIEGCGIVPVFIKPIHDNVPMLCVTTAENSGDKAEIVRQALLKVFKTDGTLAPDQMPVQVLIAAALPRNGSGKIDLYKITNGEVSGDRYSVEAVTENGQLADIRLAPMAADDGNIVRKVYKGIAKDMIEESMPGQAAKEIKQGAEAFFGMFTPGQTMQMMNMLSQTYARTMMGWMMQMSRAFGDGSQTKAEERNG